MKTASLAEPTIGFTCRVFSPEWNEFVEHWAPKIYAVVGEALGPYGTEPRLNIQAIEDGFHLAGANASFNMMTGQIQLGTHLDGQAGVTLEKLTHEMMHASLSKFPEGDPFYEEGVADYGTWVMAHAPCWGVYREEMIQAAADNIRNRRERALRTGNDYDRKRWAGGIWMMTNFGPYVIAAYRQKKLENNFTW